MLMNFGAVIGTCEFSELPAHVIREVCAEASDKGVAIKGM